MAWQWSWLFFQAEDGIRDLYVTGVQTCALPISWPSPQVMKGYWNNPEETAKVLGPDGFLATGDIGVMDEKGYVRIVDRKKDMLIVSGFNVYPNEIESVVAMHPGVPGCAVSGDADDHSGEAPQL